MTSTKKWKKILYEDQGVPDNYVDETFMNELRKNLYIKPYDYWTVVRESGVITQQVCSICIFVVVFALVADAIISPQTLFLTTVVTSFCGYLINNVIASPSSPVRVRSIFKTVSIFLGFGFCMSAVLMTLTQTISTDTIYAMTLLMFIINLLFYDYGNKAAIISQPVSLNSAIFASVCLASRLPTEWHCFAIIIFAFAMFALLPIFKANVKSYLSPDVFVILTAVLSTISLIGILSLSYLASIAFVLGHAFVTLVCPALLVNMQSYKNNIHGPWEEAVIRP